jgi:hypothetical protein
MAFLFVAQGIDERGIAPGSVKLVLAWDANASTATAPYTDAKTPGKC